MVAITAQVFLTFLQDEKLPGEMVIDKKQNGSNLDDYRVIFPANLTLDEESENNRELFEICHLGTGGKNFIMHIKGPTWIRETKYNILYLKEYYEHESHRFNWYHKNNRKYKKIRRRKSIKNIWKYFYPGKAK